MRAADATFFGTVLTSTVNVDRGWRHEVQFHVEETWTTGVVGEGAVIDVPFAVWECGRRPELSEQWLVYAMRDDDGRLTIDHCDRSHRVGDGDTDRGALGTGCDPVQTMGARLTPSTVRVGDSFSLTFATRGLYMQDVVVETDPPGAARVEPPCGPCEYPFRGFTMRAIAPGRVRVDVFGRGEAGLCEKSSRHWNWAYPQESVQLVVLPTDIYLPIALAPDAPGSFGPRTAISGGLPVLARASRRPSPARVEASAASRGQRGRSGGPPGP